MEGGALQGISLAIHEEVKWNNRAGIITSADRISYPVFQFGDPLPIIDTVLINNLNALPRGAGETTISLVSSAVGNAVFDATGVRTRQIPFTPKPQVRYDLHRNIVFNAMLRALVCRADFQ